MIELPPEASALLEKARRDHNPTADDAERVRRSLHARLGIAAALAPGMLPSQAVASAAKASSVAKGGTLLFGFKASKVLLAVVTLSGVASVPMMMRSDVTPRVREPIASCAPHCPDSNATIAHPAVEGQPVRVEPAPRAEPLHDRKAERRARRHERRLRAAEAQREQRDESEVARDEQRGEREVARDEPAAQRSGPEVEPVAPRATYVTSAAVTATTGAPAASAPSPEAESTRTSEAEAPTPRAPPELTLIRGALTSLRDGAPQRALALLGEHAQQYPEGAFASERRGLRIVALCASGRLDEGLRERVVFLRREGSAPVAERVRHACQEAPGK